MRAKFSYIVPGVFALMLVVAMSAAAQDEMPSPSSPTPSNLFTPDPANYDDKPLIMEGEKNYKTVSPILSDSLSHRVVPVPTAKQKADAKKAEAEGDPLNFNFLYYIIQKFKASELMME